MPRRTKSALARKSTIYDVAKSASVSPGTVSRALNGTGSVNADTRERILKVAQELGLKPNANTSTKIVAIINDYYPATTQGYEANVAKLLSQALARKGIAAIQPTDPIKQLPELFIDGIICVTYNQPELRKLLKEFEKTRPVVYLDKFDIEPGQYVIRSDHHNAGYLAAKHFIESGKKRLGYLAWDLPPFQVRLEGYKQALDEAKIKSFPNLLTLRSPDDNLYSAAAKIIHNGCDAIYVPGASLQAIEAMHVFQYTMGLKIPDDISIIGGENEGLSKILTPPLTTIVEPLEDMANAAVEVFSDLLQNRKIEQKVATLPAFLRERSTVSHA